VSWSQRDNHTRIIFAAALALLSGHPAASEVYKLIPHSQVIGQSSEPDEFFGVVHAFVVGGHGECSS
jgi:hypothetical protein